MVNGKQAISLMEQTAKYVQACGKRSILECKPQIFEKINLSGLKLAPIGDTFVAKTPKLTSKIAPLSKFSGGWGGLAKTTDGEVICEFQCYIRTPYLAVVNGIYPKSWIDPVTGIAKKHLYVKYMDTRFAEHQGYGREMMKRFYLQSVEQGCEGRIHLDSAWGSGGFYHKLGFEGSADAVKYNEKMLNEKLRLLKNLEEFEVKGSEIPLEIKEEALRDIDRYSKILKNNSIELESESSQMLSFTPTPKNVAKLFSK